MNKIIQIKEITNEELNSKYYWSYAGYLIKTNNYDYRVLIDNYQCCCESWGYITTNEENMNDYIGADLMDVKLTSTALATKKLSEEGLIFNGKLDLDGGGIQFVDFETSKGVLQFAVYNSHNGYYGHNIIITKNNTIVYDDTL